MHDQELAKPAVNRVVSITPYRQCGNVAPDTTDTTCTACSWQSLSLRASYHWHQQCQLRHPQQHVLPAVAPAVAPTPSPFRAQGDASSIASPCPTSYSTRLPRQSSGQTGGHAIYIHHPPAASHPQRRQRQDRRRVNIVTVNTSSVTRGSEYRRSQLAVGFLCCIFAHVCVCVCVDFYLGLRPLHNFYPRPHLRETEGVADTTMAPPRRVFFVRRLAVINTTPKGVTGRGVGRANGLCVSEC